MMFSKIGILRHRDAGTPPITGGVLQIGTGTNRVYDLIIDGLNNYSKTAVIYPSAEVGSAKTITEIELYFRSYSTPYTFNNQVIKMALVDQAAFDANPEINLSDLTVSGLITVKNNFNLTINSNNQWYSFVFDTPFVYDGVKNLMLIWENSDGSWHVGAGGNNGTTVANSVIKAASDLALPSSGLGTIYSNRPNIKIHY